MKQEENFISNIIVVDDGALLCQKIQQEQHKKSKKYKHEERVAKSCRKAMKKSSKDNLKSVFNVLKECKGKYPEAIMPHITSKRKFAETIFKKLTSDQLRVGFLNQTAKFYESKRRSSLELSSEAFELTAGFLSQKELYEQITESQSQPSSGR